MLVTNVIKREYPFTVRRKRDGEIMTMLITAESESAARLLEGDVLLEFFRADRHDSVLLTEFCHSIVYRQMRILCKGFEKIFKI